MTTRLKYIAPTIIKLIQKIENENLTNTEFLKKKIYIYSRNSVITSIFINKRVFIHNGLTFIPVYIKETMIGFKFGEFAYTRQKFIYKQTKKKHGAKK